METYADIVVTASRSETRAGSGLEMGRVDRGAVVVPGHEERGSFHVGCLAAATGAPGTLCDASDDAGKEEVEGMRTRRGRGWRRGVEESRGKRRLEMEVEVEEGRGRQGGKDGRRLFSSHASRLRDDARMPHVAPRRVRLSRLLLRLPSLLDATRVTTRPVLRCASSVLARRVLR